MSRGNIVGNNNYPKATGASGVWSLQEHYLAVKTSSWPEGFVVKTNLVLYLDAGVASSYPGTGTTWTDISGSGNNATLVNSPTYSNGAIVFNGSNQYASASLTKTASCTFSCWAKTTTVSGTPMLFNAGPDGTGPDLWFSSGVIAWNSWDSTSYSFGSAPSTVTNGAWHLYTVVTDQAANNTKLYYDGALQGSTSYKTTANNTNLYIGGTTSGYIWNGSIGLFTVNNVALSAADILKNYNIQKTRFA